MAARPPTDSTRSDSQQLVMSWDEDSKQPLTIAALDLLLDVTALVENNECPETPHPDLAELKVTLGAARLKLNNYRSPRVSSFGLALDICLQNVREALSLLKLHMATFDALASGRHKNALSGESDSVSAHDECVIEIYRADFYLKFALDQLETLFPLDAVVNIDKLIHDGQGAGFWKTAFGKKLLIPRTRFFKAFQNFLSQDLQSVEADVMYFIDFFHDDYVTPFEFNCFLDWFGPLAGSADRMLGLLKEGILAGFIPAVEAACLLVGHPPGTYLVRFSKTNVGAFALTYLSGRGKIKHCLLQTNKGSIVLTSPTEVFTNLSAFVEAHKNILQIPRKHFDGLRIRPPKPDDTGSGPQAASSSASPPADEPSTSLHQCVICLDTPVQTVFLECGHLACCKECAKPLKLCPICRSSIVRVLPIFAC